MICTSNECRELLIALKLCLGGGVEKLANLDDETLGRCIDVMNRFAETYGTASLIKNLVMALDEMDREANGTVATVDFMSVLYRFITSVRDLTLFIDAVDRRGGESTARTLMGVMVYMIISSVATLNAQGHKWVWFFVDLLEDGLRELRKESKYANPQ